jgi:hypothetical protein
MKDKKMGIDGKDRKAHHLGISPCRLPMSRAGGSSLWGSGGRKALDIRFVPMYIAPANKLCGVQPTIRARCVYIPLPRIGKPRGPRRFSTETVRTPGHFLWGELMNAKEKESGKSAAGPNEREIPTKAAPAWPPKEKPPRALMLVEHHINEWVKKHGHHSITRILLNANCWRRPHVLIARDFGLSKTPFRHFFHSICDRYKIGKETYYVVKPNVRKHLNYLEHTRRNQFEETMRIEKWILFTSGNDELLAEYENTIEMPNDYLTEEFNKLRKRMGEVSFSAFLIDVGGDMSATFVAEKWKRYGINSQKVTLWRAVVTEPSRKLKASLLRVARPPLRLAKAPAEKPSKKSGRSCSVTKPGDRSAAWA